MDGLADAGALAVDAGTPFAEGLVDTVDAEAEGDALAEVAAAVGLEIGRAHV